MFKTQFNVQPYEGATNALPSETLPDQAIPLSHLVERYLAGEPVLGTARFYDSQIDDVDYPIDDELLVENPDFFRASELMGTDEYKNKLKIKQNESNQQNYQNRGDNPNSSPNSEASDSGEEAE